MWRDNNLKRQTDQCGVILIFLLPLLLKISFNISITTIRTLFILIVALWSICRLSGAFNYKLTGFDISIFFLYLYSLIHFFIFSDTSLFYYKLWLYAGYFLTYLLFRQCLARSDSFRPNSSRWLIILLIGGLLQSIIGILQYNNIIVMSSNYVRLKGSFTSPNFLAAYIGLCMVILIWAAVTKRYFVTQHKLLWSTVFIWFAFVIVLTTSRTALLSVLGATTVLITTSHKAKHLWRKCSVLKRSSIVISCGILLVFGTIAFYKMKPSSVNGRAFVAKMSTKLIKEQPITGYGIFAFKGIYNKEKAAYFAAAPRPWAETKEAVYTFSPFNDFILLTFEMGIPILIIVLIMLAALFKARNNSYTRLGLALVTSVSIFACFNSALSDTIVMSSAVFGMALVVTFGEFKSLPAVPNRIKTRVLKPLLALFCMLLCGLVIFKLAYQNNTQNTISDLEDKDRYLKISHAKEDNLFSGLTIGSTLYKSNYTAEGLLHIEHAFRKSYAPIIGKHLAMIYIDRGNYAKAEHLFTLNMNLEPYRYEAKMDLMALYKKTNQREKLINMAKSILSFPEKIPSATIDNYKNTAKDNLKIHTLQLKHSDDLYGSLSKRQTITSKTLNKTVSYKVYLPPKQATPHTNLPVIYVNDGDKYISKGSFHKILDRLITKQKIPPIAAVFLEPIDANTQKNIRQELFLCNPNFTAFFVNELIPEIEFNYPVTTERENRTLLGLSFGGLASAFLGHNASATFKNVAMQSPAFHPCKTIYNTYKTPPKQHLKLYISYGTKNDTEKQDIPFVNILNENQYEFKLNIVEEGSHSWLYWKAQLGDIVSYFHPMP